MRSRQPKTNAAEKALKQAIAEETAALQAVIRQRDSEIARLHTVLAQVGRIVGGVAVAAPVAIAPAPQPEPEVPQVSPVELADDDNLGEGHWAP